MQKTILFVGSQWRIRVTKIGDYNVEVKPTYEKQEKDEDNVIVVPMMEHDMKRLILEELTTSMGCLVLMPIPFSNVERFACKQKFWHYVQECKLEAHVPRHFSEIPLPTNSEGTTQNVITKPFVGGGHRVFDLSRDMDKLINLWDKQKCLLQEYIDGPLEYTAHVIANQGRIVYCIMYEFDFKRDVFIKGCNLPTHRKKYTDMDEEVAFLEQFLLPCKYHGQCNFNYKVSKKDGIKKVFEINPRLGGSLMLSQNAKDLQMYMLALLKLFDK